MKKYKIIYLILGIIFLINALVFNMDFFVKGLFPKNIILFALSIMSFCLFNISEHLVLKDERSKKIKERSVYISYFWSSAFLIVLLVALNPYSPLISINAGDLVMLIISIHISIIFITLTLYSKKY